MQEKQMESSSKITKSKVFAKILYRTYSDPGILKEFNYEGYDIPPFYDSMIGKLFVHGTNRDNAIAIARDSLDQFEVEGIATTIGLHRRLIGHSDLFHVVFLYLGKFSYSKS